MQFTHTNEWPTGYVNAQEQMTGGSCGCAYVASEEYFGKVVWHNDNCSRGEKIDDIHK
jgi:hypothetical protein